MPEEGRPTMTTPPDRHHERHTYETRAPASSRRDHCGAEDRRIRGADSRDSVDASDRHRGRRRDHDGRLPSSPSRTPARTVVVTNFHGPVNARNAVFGNQVAGREIQNGDIHVDGDFHG
jgi:hypothetical protein